MIFGTLDATKGCSAFRTFVSVDDVESMILREMMICSY